MQELKYTINEDKRCLLDCPYSLIDYVTGNIIKIGSMTCYYCSFCIDVVTTENIVLCNKDETK